MHAGVAVPVLPAEEDDVVEEALDERHHDLHGRDEQASKRARAVSHRTGRTNTEATRVERKLNRRSSTEKRHEVFALRGLGGERRLRHNSSSHSPGPGP